MLNKENTKVDANLVILLLNLLINTVWNKMGNLIIVTVQYS